jgi:hypothetical protein
LEKSSNGTFVWAGGHSVKLCGYTALQMASDSVNVPLKQFLLKERPDFLETKQVIIAGFCTTSELAR